MRQVLLLLILLLLVLVLVLILVLLCEGPNGLSDHLALRVHPRQVLQNTLQEGWVGHHL